MITRLLKSSLTQINKFEYQKGDYREKQFYLYRCQKRREWLYFEFDKYERLIYIVELNPNPGLLSIFS